MEKLQRLKNKLAELGYRCDVITDNNKPCLKIWLVYHLVYIVYANGEFDEGDGIFLATDRLKNEIQKAIRQWVDDEGLCRKQGEA